LHKCYYLPVRYKYGLSLVNLLVIATVAFFSIQLKITDNRLSKYTFCIYGSSIAAGPSNEPCIGGDEDPLPAAAANDESLQVTDEYLLIMLAGLLFTIAAFDGFYLSKIKKRDGFVLLSLILIVLIPWVTLLLLSFIQASSNITNAEKEALGYISVPLLLMLDYSILNYGIRLAHKQHFRIWLSVYVMTLFIIGVLTAGAIVYLITAL
jgi:hypothetical protein